MSRVPVSKAWGKADWRGRCAESLGDSNDERALRVVLTLLKAREESVVIHAIESIESVFWLATFTGRRSCGL